MLNNKKTFKELIDEPVELDIVQQKDGLESQNQSENDEYLVYNIPSIDEGTDYQIRKLTLVSLVCFLLMTVEFIGGYLAGSLAVMTDAAHLFSDISGFSISILSLYLVKQKSTKVMTFGYHRAEILGALSSIVIIWVLTIYLFLNAVERLINQNFEVDGEIMLITSIFGLLCNLCMFQILHNGPGHSHSHSSHGHSHGKQHSHNDGHNHDGHSHDGHSHDGHSHDGHSHDGHSHDDHGHNHDDHEHSHDNHGHSHDNHGHNHDDHGHNHNDHGHSHDDHGKKDGAENINNQDIQSHNREQIGNELNIKSKQQKNKKEKNVQQFESTQSMNLRAAMIHIIGDICQSIGVIIAAIIIYLNPEYKLADPITTFLFSILVIFTTVPVANDCVHILMEACPNDIDLVAIENDLIKIQGVQDIHDLHIWSLSSGKPSLTAHITATDVNDVQRKATLICRKYKIFHTTLQIEDFDLKNDSQQIECAQHIH